MNPKLNYIHNLIKNNDDLQVKETLRLCFKLIASYSNNLGNKVQEETKIKLLKHLNQIIIYLFILFNYIYNQDLLIRIVGAGVIGSLAVYLTDPVSFLYDIFDSSKYATQNFIS